MKIKTTLLFLLLLQASACDMLNKEPESAFTQANFYQTPSDAISAVSAVYDPLLHQSMYNQFMFAYQDQGTDDSEWGGGRNTANQAKNDLDRYTFTPATVYFYGTWSTCYQAINRANAAIERIPGIKMDANLQSRLVAEATFLRGFYYFTLVRLYGKVPIVLTETASLNNLSVPRAPIEEVYEQIIADFTLAASVLPTSYTGADRGRATQGAAKAFLAKVYLTRQEWTKAATQCLEIMEMEKGGIYALLDNYADVFLVTNKNSKEAIFEAQALSGGFGEGTPMEGFMRPPFDRSGFGDDPVTENHYQAYANNDKRRDVNVRLYSTTGTPAAPASIAFPCYVAKYQDPASTGNGDGGNNFPILRYADVLLMYAEALNEQAPGQAEAYAAINRVRKRAGLDELPTGLDQAQFREAVLLERRLELAFEGHRRYDLIRTGKLIEAMQAQNPGILVEPRHYLYPVPQIEKDANPLLDQNEGY
jgi:starch-binding outer membrane protein, SusD/RagB family